ncbi:MAG: sulfatase-like hydrolase/transferase [Bacteroidota bacterium]
MADKPRNIIFLISDSLRFDSVYDIGVGMPYVQENSIEFLEARAAGCWTLPATASMFTGLMPHEHGATSQTRAIHLGIPTLAEKMKSAGYKTYQVTANVATTHIFGLNRGFDEVRRIWKLVDPKFNKLQQLIALVGKPRLRRKLISGDMLMQRMTEDLESAKTWLQFTYDDIFNECRKIIKENEAKGESSFIFLNLMETHFPYHLAPTFQLSTDGIIKKVREVISMFHYANQTFLKKKGTHIKPDMMEVLKNRQKTAWKSLAPNIDNFCREMHEDQGNLVVFGSDHGENFGEHGWIYHFSNITDAGNKVPMFWLPANGETPRKEHSIVSTRHIFNSFLHEVGLPTEGPSMVHHPEGSKSIMQSYWYNNRNKTLEKYKFNQICFLFNDNRYLMRNNVWYEAPFKTGYDEPDFKQLPADANPLYDLTIDAKDKQDYLKIMGDFKEFSSKITFENRPHVEIKA